MGQDGLGLARVVVAVVIEEDDLAAQFALEAAGGHYLGVKEPARKKAARLLTEANARRTHDKGRGTGRRHF